MGGSSSKEDTGSKGIHGILRNDALTENDKIREITTKYGSSQLDQILKIINETDPADGMTPLARAVARGEINVARFLLNQGADYTITGIGAKTKRVAPLPIIIAIVTKNYNMIELLIERGADINTPTNLPHGKRTGLELAKQMLDSKKVEKYESESKSKCSVAHLDSLAKAYVPPEIFKGDTKNSEAYLTQLHHIEEKISNLESAMESQSYLNTVGANSNQYGGKRHKGAKRGRTGGAKKKK